jgi:hypothetical protein
MPRRRPYWAALQLAHMRSHGQTAIGAQHLRINNVGVVISSVPIEALVGAGGFDALAVRPSLRVKGVRQ